MLGLPTKTSDLLQALEQRAEHEWGDVIPMLDDALGDRDHDAEATCYYDVWGVSQGDIPVRSAARRGRPVSQLGLPFGEASSSSRACAEICNLRPALQPQRRPRQPARRLAGGLGWLGGPPGFDARAVLPRANPAHIFFTKRTPHAGKAHLLSSPRKVQR
jgi:hypothetical protein